MRGSASVHSEDEDGGDGDGGYDYELETAKKSGVPVGTDGVGRAGAYGAAEESMSERLKVEGEVKMMSPTRA